MRFNFWSHVWRALLKKIAMYSILDIKMALYNRSKMEEYNNGVFSRKKTNAGWHLRVHLRSQPTKIKKIIFVSCFNCIMTNPFFFLVIFLLIFNVFSVFNKYYICRYLKNYFYNFYIYHDFWFPLHSFENTNQNMN